MKPWHVRILSYLILALLYATAIFALQGYLLKKCEGQVKDKPGLAEIKAIAETNDISPSEISFALQKEKRRNASFPLLLVTKLVTLGFVLASFGIVNAVVSRIARSNDQKAQQRRRAKRR